MHTFQVVVRDDDGSLVSFLIEAPNFHAAVSMMVAEYDWPRILAVAQSEIEKE